MQHKQAEYYDSYHKDSPEHWQTPTNTHLSQTKLDYFSNLLDVDVKEREVPKLRQLLLHKVNNLNILLKNCDHVDAAEKNITVQ